jgi:hypothetical protein
MRSIRPLAAAAVLALLAAAAPAPAAAVHGTEAGYTLHYTVEATGQLNAALTRMDLTTTLTITTPDAGMDSLLLGVLPNAYRAWTTIGLRVDGVEVAPDWRTPLGLAIDLRSAPWAAASIHTITVAGTIDWTRSNNTTGRLRRFGSGGSTVLLAGDFLPLPVRAAPWPVWSDPVDAATAQRIRFTLRAAAPLRAGAVILSGSQTAVSSTEWRAEIAPARSYALAVAPSSTFAASSTKTAGITVTAYGTSSSVRAADRNAAARAVRIYASKFGPAPYSSLKVVNAGLSSTQCAHEFPGVVFVCSGWTGGPRTHLVHHEVAHQWWYGLVATDQREDPWLDESLAEFSAQRSYGWTKPFTPGDCTQPIDGRSRGSGGSAEGGFSYAHEFGRNSYQECVYDRGASFWFTVGRTIGFAKLEATLRSYAAANRFGSPGPVALVRALIAADRRVLTLLNPGSGRYPWVSQRTVDAAR